MPLKKLKLIGALYVGPPCYRLQPVFQLPPHSTPPSQVGKLRPRALPLCPSTGDGAKPSAVTLGNRLVELISGGPAFPANPQPPGPPRKENRTSSHLHKFNPCCSGPQGQSPSRPRLPSLGLPRPSHPPHLSLLGSGLPKVSRSVPTLTPVEYGHMALV